MLSREGPLKSVYDSVARYIQRAGPLGKSLDAEVFRRLLRRGEPKGGKTVGDDPVRLFRKWPVKVVAAKAGLNVPDG